MNSEIQKHTNSVITGPCSTVLSKLPASSVDFVLTDPPYLTSYRPRDGRTVTNDQDDAWLQPSFKEIFRVLRPDSFCVTFYGWPTAERFMEAFRLAGFRPVSHLCFVKDYPSFRGYTLAQHEVALVLAKGRPEKPTTPLSDVIQWKYTGNKLHPTQKPVSVLTPIVEAFSKPGDIVLDPFCGSGSTLVAAKLAKRHFIGIDIETAHANLATRRMQGYEKPRAA